MSENVPFNSYKFKQFTEEWGYEVITLSPNYPKSNSLAEKDVHIAKTIFKKSIYTNLDL